MLNNMLNNVLSNSNQKQHSSCQTLNEPLIQNSSARNTNDSSKNTLTPKDNQEFLKKIFRNEICKGINRSQALDLVGNKEDNIVDYITKEIIFNPPVISDFSVIVFYNHADKVAKMYPDEWNPIKEQLKKSIEEHNGNLKGPGKAIEILKMHMCINSFPKEEIETRDTLYKKHGMSYLGKLTHDVCRLI